MVYYTHSSINLISNQPSALIWVLIYKKTSRVIVPEKPRIEIHLSVLVLAILRKRRTLRFLSDGSPKEDKAGMKLCTRLVAPT